MSSDSDLAVRVRGLSKAYTIAHQGERPATLAESLLSRARRPFARSPKETFWALKDVEFDIAKGDVVGIIGRNGAGKSTLLKVLSRITEPTTGTVDMYGRVGSLLEVGTGFHPELTGRENVFLNGAILGMTKGEIRRQFDAIVDFAGVEKFLDTPVKRYSSGMYVRLAFAVAAHLNSEILIVDEVLAVGDNEFQRRCLGKMGEVAKTGRTVFLVSHNMTAVEKLCGRSVYLNQGSVVSIGSTDSVISQYVSDQRTIRTSGTGRPDRPSWATPFIEEVRIDAALQDGIPSVPLGSSVKVEVDVAIKGLPPLREPVLGIIINRTGLGVVGGINTRMTGFPDSQPILDRATLACTLERAPLLPGDYNVDVWLGDGPIDLDTINAAASFTVETADIYGTGHAPFKNMGAIYLEGRWAFLKQSDVIGPKQ